MTEPIIAPLEPRHLPELERLVAEHLRSAGYPFDASPAVLRKRVERVLGSDGLFAERLHVCAVVGQRGFEWRETSYLMWGSGPVAFGGDVNREVRVTLDVLGDGVWRFSARLDGAEVGEMLVVPMDRPTGWQPTWSGGRWIDWVHVVEDARRRGVASALFAALADRAGRSGVQRVAASTRYQAAIRLNERLGMTERLALRRYALPRDTQAPLG